MATVKPLVRLALAACCGTLLFGCNQATEQPKPGDDAAKPAAAAEKPPAPEKLKDDPILTSRPGVAVTGPQGKRLSVWIAQLQGDDANARVEAAMALGNLQYMLATEKLPSYGEKPPDAVIQALAKALKDTDKGVRMMAAQSLKRYGPLGVPAFLEALKDQDAAVRENAAGAVGRISFGMEGEGRYLGVWPDTAEAVVPALGELLLKDKDKKVRETAAGALPAFGEPSVPTLLKALRTGDKDARRLAVRALASFPWGTGGDGKPIYPRILCNDDPGPHGIVEGRGHRAAV